MGGWMDGGVGGVDEWRDGLASLYQGEEGGGAETDMHEAWAGP